MSITVEVGLLSGKTAVVKADVEETVRTLQLRAQCALGLRKGRLVHLSGALDAGSKIKDTEIQNGDSWTLFVQVQIQASLFALAAIVDDGSVVTWGRAGNGGDSEAVPDQLKNVQWLQATSQSGFPAMLADDTVVTWGPAEAVVLCGFS